MQVALEKKLRLNIQVLAAKADLSMKNWILDNILSIHRKVGMEAYLSEAYGSVIILAPPTNACLLYTSPSPRDKRQSRMPSSA